MATIHDSGYKLLFSNHTIFRQLIQSFVDQPWVAQLDFERAEKVDKSFIDEAYQERESDLIYRIPLGAGEIYVYVLLEFQSTVDPLMALRVLNYVVSLYMELTRNPRTKKLPPVFPIVLYNGDGRWTAATDVADLIEPVPSLGEYGLHYRYLKLAENEFSQEVLIEIGNIVSTLFLAENRYEMVKLLARLPDLFEREEDKRAASLLVNWFRHMALHGRISPEDYAQMERVFRSKEEVERVLTTTFEDYYQEALQKGIEVGIEKGIEKGIEEGIEKGIEEGIEKGIEKGAKANQAKTVLAMAERGFAWELIADLLELGVVEVEEIIARATTVQANGNSGESHE